MANVFSLKSSCASVILAEADEGVLDFMIFSGSMCTHASLQLMHGAVAHAKILVQVLNYEFSQFHFVLY